MAFGVVVLCEDPVALCVENNERVDTVKRKVHDGVTRP
jgi:hypothetical protein